MFTFIIDLHSKKGISYYFLNVVSLNFGRFRTKSVADVSCFAAASYVYANDRSKATTQQCANRMHSGAKCIQGAKVPYFIKGPSST